MLNRVESWYTAVMNKPWRIFCRPGTKFVELYECRGTRFIASSHKSRYTRFYRKHWSGRVQASQICLGAGVNCKKCDKQMTFIVRVMFSRMLNL